MEGIICLLRKELGLGNLLFYLYGELDSSSFRIPFRAQNLTKINISEYEILFLRCDFHDGAAYNGM